MYRTFILALKEQIIFYKSATPLNFILIAILHIFIAWNGIQFIILPAHLNYILDHNSVMTNFRILTGVQANFIPLFVFICVTFILLYFFIRNFCEIINLKLMKKDILSGTEGGKARRKEIFDLLINFSIPSFFHNFILIFILSSIYLMLLIIYIILLVFNVQITLDVFSILRYSLFYFLIGLVVFNTITIDFVLPELQMARTFSDSLQKFFRYFLSNKLNVCFFYSLKFCLMALNIMIFIYCLNLFIYEPILRLPVNIDIYSCLFNTFTLFIGVFISLMLNSIFMQFFSIYCFKFQQIVFRDYAEFVDETFDISG